jgi:hypothetical protein
MKDILYYIEEKDYKIIDVENYLSNEVFEKLKKERIIRVFKDDLTSCKFSFVGMLSISGSILIVLPKYLTYSNLSSSNKIIEARLVLQVLRKYAKKTKREEDLNYLSLNSEDSYFNMIAISDYLINDYLEYGIYFDEVDELDFNGTGEINWVMTIEKEPAYFSNNQVIYLNYMTETSESDENTYVSQLHKLVLNECIEFMKKLEFLELFNCPNILFQVHENLLGDIDFKIKKLNDKLSKSFSQRDVGLIKTLLLFLENSALSITKDIQSLYGIKNFEHTWENVTSDVIGNDYKRLEKYIPKPVWEKKNPRPRYQAQKATLKPDILKIIDNKLFIFDAKYYKPIFEDGELNDGHPGVGDISKQYLYEQAFKKTRYNPIHNFFLIPCYLEKTDIVGKVIFPLFDDTEYGDIFLVNLNTNIIFNLYLDDKKYESCFFTNLLTKIY